MPISPFNIYLAFGDFKGDVTADRYADEIAVVSCDERIAVARSGSGGGGGGAGRPDFSDFRFRKTLDRSSPLLMLACATGQHVREARFAFVRESPDGRECYRITLSNVAITGIDQIAGDGAQYPLSFDMLDVGTDTHGILESLSLSYTRIVWEYFPIGRDGKALPPVKAGWDVQTGRKI